MDAKKTLGEIVRKARLARDLSRDEYGAQFDVSGPAIFKVDNSFLRPSLAPSLKWAKDAGIAERRAVLLWGKTMLPLPYQEHVDLVTGVRPPRRRARSKKVGYSRLESRENLQKAMAGDGDLPQELIALVGDDELWALYRPTGREIGLLRDTFSLRSEKARRRPIGRRYAW